jgi:hypothetical protein
VRIALILVVLAVVAMLVASRIRAAARGIVPDPPLQLDQTHREVRFTATLQSAVGALECVVRSKESAPLTSALFVSDSSADSVLAAFGALDPHHGGDGAPVDLLVHWPGSGGRRFVADIIAEGRPRSPRLDFRLPGNAEPEESEAGCIVRVASSSHPNGIQQTTGGSIAERFPRPGTPVVLTLKSRMEEA